MHLTFTMKQGKPLCTPMKEICEAIINLQPPNQPKIVDHFVVWIIFCNLSLNNLENNLYPDMRYRNRRFKFKWVEECMKALENIKDCQRCIIRVVDKDKCT